MRAVSNITRTRTHTHTSTPILNTPYPEYHLVVWGDGLCPLAHKLQQEPHCSKHTEVGHDGEEVPGERERVEGQQLMEESRETATDGRE